jgi:hypothetical protein
LTREETNSMTSVQGNDSDGLGFGVEGTSTTGTGVVGNSDNVGVSGQSSSGVGVTGVSDSGNAVLGESTSGVGVGGVSGTGNGVTGQSKEENGANGVLGLTSAATGSGVFGSNDNKKGGNGVTGMSQAGFGVFGQTEATGPQDIRVAGVAGFSDRGDGVLGQTSTGESFGVHGVNRSGFGDGVRGEGNNGVHGITTTGNIFGAGVRGETQVNASGVLGVAPVGYGVAGVSGGIGAGAVVALPNAGVLGINAKGPGVAGYGSDSQPGVFAQGSPTAITAFGAVSVLGDVSATGTIGAPIKKFRIDHPLDPANKYLNHASVESSEMKTIYDGIAVLDDQGQAIVELPVWFEALNTAFRYQLTPIGAPAPGLHIAEEVSTNRFKIAGGPAKLKVCWQVTGIRHDASAQALPLIVETDKSPEEQGYYLHPEYHGQPQERGINWVRDASLRHLVEQLRTSSGD